MNGPVAFTEIRWRPTDSLGVWDSVRISPTQSSIFIPGLERGIEYTIEARNVGPTGLSSEWVSVFILPRLQDRPLTPLDIDPDDNSITIDCKVEEQFTINLIQNIDIVNFINVSQEKILLLYITQRGQFSITWPASVNFESGIPYVPTQVVDKVDTVGLATADSGGRWIMRTNVNVSEETGGTGDDTGNPAPPPGETILAISGDNIIGGCFASGGACAPSGTANMAVVGGSSPYTFLWTFITGNASIVPSAINVLNPVFTGPSGTTNATFSAIFRFTVIDSSQTVKTKDITVNLERFSAL